MNRLRYLEVAGSGDTTELLRAVFAEAYGRFSDIATARAPGGPDVVVHPGGGVSVKSSEMVSKVYLDPDENYSVSGYRDRARTCFGEIYLCLDKGAEYYRQSAKVNAAIQAVTGREAFDLAIQKTRAIVADNPDAAREPGKHIDSVSIKVLAALCVHWFSLPNNVDVVEGGMNGGHLPPRCPGTFALPSAYMFKPDPSPDLIAAGQVTGGLLKGAVKHYVDTLKASQQVPAGGLSRATFDAFPQGEDDLIAQTIIGVMMGKLPTVDHNLINVVQSWSDQTLDALRTELKNDPGRDAYQRACDHLMVPIKHAMQANPVPDAVWRTAVKAHTLGETSPVQINPGDKVRVEVAAATQEDLAAGITDVFAVFGGNRGAAPHPTHACPAYHMAMGIMLGVVNGLLEP